MEENEGGGEEEFFPFAEHAEDLMHDLSPLFKSFPLSLFSQSLLHIIEVHIAILKNIVEYDSLFSI